MNLPDTIPLEFPENNSRKLSSDMNMLNPIEIDMPKPCAHILDYNWACCSRKASLRFAVVRLRRMLNTSLFLQTLPCR